MYIAFDCRQDDLAFGALLSIAALGFLRFDEGHQMRHSLFHDTGTFDHLRQKHLATGKKIPDDAHTVHQRAFNDVKGSGDGQSRLFSIFHDMAVYALDQGMGQAIFDLEFAPGVCLRFFGRGSATIIFGQRQQSLGGIGASI